MQHIIYIIITIIGIRIINIYYSNNNKKLNNIYIYILKNSNSSHSTIAIGLAAMFCNLVFKTLVQNI